MAQNETDDAAVEHAADAVDGALPDHPRAVVVTGGGTGIGRAVAERFAAAGDDVVIIGRRAEMLRATAAELTAAYGREVVPIVCDLADPAGVEAVLPLLPPRIDVLV